MRLNTPVDQLERAQDTKWIVRSRDGQTIEADAVCLAVPSYVAAKLLRDVDANLAGKLGEIQFASTATVNLAYRRSNIPHALDGFGFVVPYIERRSLIACTFSSVKFSGRAPDGYVLLRAFVGGALQPEMFALSESEMVERVIRDLRDLLGIEREPLFTEVAKWANSMPQYQIGHLQRVGSIEQELLRLPGLTLAGNPYRGAGIPDCIRCGEQAAEAIGNILEF